MDEIIGAEWSYITAPTFSWECNFFNGVLVVSCKESDIPNWFWRKMQYIFFGIKWIKLKGS